MIKFVNSLRNKETEAGLHLAKTIKYEALNISISIEMTP